MPLKEDISINTYTLVYMSENVTAPLHDLIQFVTPVTSVTSLLRRM